MGLETGTYISDLNPNWPVDATDQVGEGDDHLRLIKKTILNTWPSLTGAVNLTQDQINDAALKSAANTFTGESTFNARVNLANGIPMAGLDTVGTPRNIVSISGSNNVEFGNTSLDLHLHYSGAQGHYFYHGGSSGANRVLQTDSRANGSLKIADSAGVFGNVAAVHKAQTFTANQIMNTTLTLENNRAINMKESGGTERTMLFVSGSNAFNCGSASLPVLLKGTSVSMEHTGTVTAFTDTRNNGSLKIYDRFGVSRKVGFRGPAWRSKTADHALVQDDEGTILNSSVSGITYTLDQLEAFTTVRIVNRSSGNITIAEGAGVTLSTRLGGSVLTGNRTVASHSVVELSYRSSTQVDMFGNGIS